MSYAVIHWDLENQALPYGSSVPSVCGKIIDVARQHYEHISELYCYYDSSKKVTSNSRVKELSMMGFDTIDCVEGKSNAVDMRIIVRALKPRPPNVPQPGIVLVTGDGDYAYAASALRNANIPVLLIYNSDNMSIVNTMLIEIAPTSVGISFSGRAPSHVESGSDAAFGNDAAILDDAALNDEQTCQPSLQQYFLMAIERSPAMQDGWRLSTTVGELFHKITSTRTTKADFRTAKRQLLEKNRIESHAKKDYLRAKVVAK